MPELDEVHGGSIPALKPLYLGINEFKRGRSCTKDEARSGRPVDITTKDIIKTINGIHEMYEI